MRWRDLLLPSLPSRSVRPGMQHFRIERPDRMTRVHLRVEEDGAGVMLVDATVAVRLNRTGMELARAILEGKPLEAARRELRKTFRSASAEQVGSDYEKIRQVLFPTDPDKGACPWLDLAAARGYHVQPSRCAGLSRGTPGALTSPHRVDAGVQQGPRGPSRPRFRACGHDGAWPSICAYGPQALEGRAPSRPPCHGPRQPNRRFPNSSALVSRSGRPAAASLALRLPSHTISTSPKSPIQAR